MLTVGQSAALIGMSEHTLRRWSDKGERITAHRIGPQGRRRFILGDVIRLRDSFVERHHAVA